MTAEAELQALSKLSSDLQRERDLEEKIDECKELIDEEKSREVDKFEGPINWKRVHGEIESKRFTKSIIISSVFALLYVIYSIVETISISSGVGDAILYFVFIAFGICIPFGVVGFINDSFKCETPKAFCLPLSFIVLSVENLAGGYLFCFFTKSYLHIGLYYCRLAQASIACGVLAFIISAVLILAKFKSDKIKLAQAKENDDVAFEKYEERRKKAEEELRAEVAGNIGRIEQTMANYSQELKDCRKRISANKILADQDKNIYLVSTLLGYFDRRRISSIKEGINLFEREQRRDRMERDARQARFRQEMALKEMREEQEAHNEEMRKIAREAQKKIDDALDELKYGR